MQAAVQAAFLRALCAEVGPAAVSIRLPNNPQAAGKPSKRPFMSACWPLFPPRRTPSTCVRGRSRLGSLTGKVCERPAE